MWWSDLEKRLYLVNQPVFENGMADLPVQLVEGLHLIHGDCKEEEGAEQVRA